MDQRAFDLDSVKVASPCSEAWEKMSGDERARFCAACSLTVYNLSAMSRADAEALILKKEGRLCVRFYRRADGTILTADCPVGLAAVRRRVALYAAAFADAHRRAHVPVKSVIRRAWT